MSYMTKDQLENYLNGLPSSNKEKKSEYRQIKNELVYPMQQMSVQEQEQEDGVTYSTIQDRMKRLRNSTGTAISASDTSIPAFPETPKPMLPTKPSFSSSESDAFEVSLNPRSYAQRRQQRQQQQQQEKQPLKQQQSEYAPPVQQQKPPTPPLPPLINPVSTPPPVVPSSPRPPKPNNRESMVRTLNPIYAGLECPACHQPIDGSVVSAMNKIWHSSCFNCKRCKKTLENEQYFEKDGQPYCGKDYRNMFSLHCDFCHEPIENSAISALGKHYHEGHFGCTACKRPFDDHSAFMVHEGKPYCQEDYLKICGKKCSGCSEYISGEYINALGQEWHKSCFNCFDCKKPFTNGTFLVNDNKPYCEEHYRHRGQQNSNQPVLEQKPQQPLRPPAIKPKPLLTKKPDTFLRPEVEKHDISNYPKNIPESVKTRELNRPETTNYSGSFSNNASRTSTEVKRPEISTSSNIVKNVTSTSTSGCKICRQCNEVIDGPSASALGHDYHIHHFQCCHCSRALSSRVPGMWQGDTRDNLICKMCAFKQKQ